MAFVAGRAIAIAAPGAICPAADAQAAENVLTRNVDRRPLPVVSRDSLSAAVQKTIQAMEDEQRKAFGASYRATPASLTLTVSRIPVAPHGHRVYFVAMGSEMGCTGNGPNCREAVLDETQADVTTVDDGGFTGVAVVRRPALQMPDIAFYEQEGHFGTTTTVYRFDGARWRRYLCKYVSPIGDDPNPAVVADKPCAP